MLPEVYMYPKFSDTKTTSWHKLYVPCTESASQNGQFPAWGRVLPCSSLSFLKRKKKIGGCTKNFSLKRCFLSKYQNYLSTKKLSCHSRNWFAVPSLLCRQLEAVVRIAESIAKMSLQPFATEGHIDEALRLFQISTLDAALSGSLSGQWTPVVLHLWPCLSGMISAAPGHVCSHIGRDLSFFSSWSGVRDKNTHVLCWQKKPVPLQTGCFCLLGTILIYSNTVDRLFGQLACIGTLWDRLFSCLSQ